MALINLKRGIDPGTYRLKILSIDETFGPSGYPYLTMQLEITRGDAKGLSFSEMMSLSPRARFRVEGFLDAIEAPQKGQVDSSTFVGKHVWGEVDIDSSRDPARPRVVKWLLPSEMSGEAETEEELEKEEEQFTQNTIAELEEEDDDPFASITEKVEAAAGKKK